MKLKGGGSRQVYLGICNGFQILTEAGLLPGALTAQQQHEIPLSSSDCLKVENNTTAVHE